MREGGAVVVSVNVIVRDINTAVLVNFNAVVAPLEHLISEVSLPGATEESHQLSLPDVSPGQLSHNKYQLKAFTLLSVVTDILVLSRILERSSLSSLGLPSLIIPAVSSLTKTINNSNNKIKVELYN